jgi:hypothetical protein
MMTRAGRLALALLMSTVVVQLGCEDSPPPPPPRVQQQVQQAEAAQAETARPTTQELLAGPTRRITLATWALSIEVPASWELDTSNPQGFVFLEGYAPSGPVQIQLAQRPAVNAEQLGHMVEAARKDVAVAGRAQRTVDFREGRQFKIFERKGASATVMLTVLDSDGQTREVPHTPYSWTINLLVPQEQTYANYELNFFDLTQDQYEADRPFFEKILDTLQLEAHAAPAETAPTS